MSEHLEQCAYFEWVRIKQKQDIRYYMISSSQNGAPLKNGAYSYVKLARAGFSKGFPDIACLVPSSTFHGLFIEMKKHPNKLTEDQQKWLDRLNNQGYQAVVAWSASEAISITEAYLNFAFYRQSEERQKLSLVPKANCPHIIKVESKD